MVFLGIASFFLPVLLIVFVIVAIVKGKNSNLEKDGEDMFKQLYVYLVLFTMLLMTVGGGIAMFMGVANLVSPTANYQTFTDFKNENVTTDEKGKIAQPVLSDSELHKEYIQSINDQKNQDRDNAKHDIISSLGFIVIPFPIFLYFNRMRKNESPKQV